MICIGAQLAPEGAPLNDFWVRARAVLYQLRPDGGKGNKIGHQPAAPTLWPAQVATTDVKPLQDAIEKADRIYWDRKCLRQLGPARSELRESVVVVLRAILPRMDLVTKRVGTRAPDPETNHMPGLTLAWMCEQTGLGYSRVKRALHRLLVCGLMTGSRVWEEKEDGTYGGRPSARTVNMAVFHALGVSLRVKAAAKRAYRKLKAIKQSIQAAKFIGRGQVASTVKATTEKRSIARELSDRGNDARAARISAAAPIDQVTNEGRRLAELQIQIMQAHPDWTLEQLQAEFTRRRAALKG